MIDFAGREEKGVPIYVRDMKQMAGKWRRRMRRPCEESKVLLLFATARDGYISIYIHICYLKETMMGVLS